MPSSARPSSSSHRDNKEALQEAAAMQQDTQEAIQRIQRQAAETQDVGNMTLDQLEEQRRTMGRILGEGDRLHDHLDKTEKLQNKIGRWAFKFNRGAARREAREDQRVEERRKALKEKRTAAARGSRYQDSSQNKNEPVIVPHRKLTTGSGRGTKDPEIVEKQSKAANVAHGVSGDSEYHAEVTQLAETDAILDDALDGVGAQLDAILAMSKTINTEVKSQEQTVQEIDTQLQDAKHKQQVVNNRARRFLTGKVRRQYEKQNALGKTFG